MKNIICISLLFFLLSSCAPAPKPIDYGSDGCHFCKMTIVDHQHAAEAVTDKGKVYKFDAIECLVNYLDRNPEEAFAYLLVNDYEEPKALIDAETSYYLISEAIPSPMGAYLSGFADRAAAERMQAEKGGSVYDWKALQQELTRRNGEH